MIDMEFSAENVMSLCNPRAVRGGTPDFSDFLTAYLDTGAFIKLYSAYGKGFYQKLPKAKYVVTNGVLKELSNQYQRKKRGDDGNPVCPFGLIDYVFKLITEEKVEINYEAPNKEDMDRLINLLQTGSGKKRNRRLSKTDASLIKQAEKNENSAIITTDSDMNYILKASDSNNYKVIKPDELIEDIQFEGNAS